MRRPEWSLVWLSRGMHLLAVLVAVLLLGGGWGAGRWLSVLAHSARAMQDEVNACLAREVEIRENRQGLGDALQEATRKADSLEVCLTDGPQEAQLVAQFSEISQKTNLKIKSFRPGRKAEHGTVGDLEIRLSCEGSYESLCAFLAELQALPRLCHISTFDLSPIDAGGASVAAEFQLHVLFRTPTKPMEPRPEVNDAT